MLLKLIFRLLPFIISLSWKHLNITLSIVLLIYPTVTTTFQYPPFMLGGKRRRVLSEV